MVDDNAILVQCRINQFEFAIAICIAEYRHAGTDRRGIDEKIIVIDQVLTDQASRKTGAAVGYDVLTSCCLSFCTSLVRS